MANVKVVDDRSADKVGDCYVFDIGGNNFRLIAKIISRRGSRS